jgi:hypothetical protein
MDWINFVIWHSNALSPFLNENKMGNSNSLAVEPSENLSQGIQKNRKCRDVVFILLFAIYWVGMFIVCATAVKNGDIRRLT